MTPPPGPAPRELFERLVDDAAMFPPGNAAAPEAIACHLRYRESWFSPTIGPLLVPARGWDAFAAAHAEAGSPSLRVVLIGASEPPRDIPDGISLVGFELPVPTPPLPPTGERALAAELPAGPAGDPVLAAVAMAHAGGRAVAAKFRTGGVSADAFPDEKALADVLDRAVRAGAPLKLTAGLHHAVRFTAEETGFEHHGFCNVLVAVRALLDGASPDAVAAVLAERDGRALAAGLAAWTPERAAETRRAFISFGCCGVTDPVDDLVSLGLLMEVL